MDRDYLIKELLKEGHDIEILEIATFEELQELYEKGTISIDE